LLAHRPHLLTYQGIVAVLSGLWGRSVTYREVTMEENRDAMIGAGVPESIAGMNAQAFS
jgi:hypothetical protein